MRIAVFGAGAVGGFLGGMLAKSGEEVALIARGDHLRTIQKDGLRLEGPRGNFTVRPAIVTDDALKVGPVDVVILGLKATQLQESAAAMNPLLGQDTCIVPVQNGMGITEEVESLVGGGHAVVGVTVLTCTILGPGHVRHFSGIDPYFRFGEKDNRPSKRTDRLRDALRKANVSAATPPEIDVHAEVWAKFCFVVPMSGVGAVTRVPLGEWRHSPGSRRMWQESMGEIAALAKARKVRLPEGYQETLTKVLEGYPPDVQPSMQRDIAAGRPSELDYQIGATVRMGRDSGVPTPVNDFIYAALLPLETRAREAHRKSKGG